MQHSGIGTHSIFDLGICPLKMNPVHVHTYFRPQIVLNYQELRPSILFSQMIPNSRQISQQSLIHRKDKSFYRELVYTKSCSLDLDVQKSHADTIFLMLE